MRQQSCPTGKPAFRHRADALAANPGARVQRCDRCRFWHVSAKRKKGRR